MDISTNDKLIKKDPLLDELYSRLEEKKKKYHKNPMNGDLRIEIKELKEIIAIVEAQQRM